MILSIPAKFWVGGRGQVAYVDPISSSLVTFGHGQRLNTFTVNRNYQAVYTIGDRKLTHIPYGRFEVTWRVEANLSDPSVFHLLFTSTGTTSPTTWTITDVPVFTTIHIWHSQTAEANSHIKLVNAVADTMSLEMDATGNGLVSVSLEGGALNIERDSIPASSYTVGLSTVIYTFVGATLMIDGSPSMPVRRLSIDINQSGERVYAIGSDKAVGAFYGELNLEATLQMPASSSAMAVLDKVLANQDYSSLVITLGGFPVTGTAVAQTITIALTSPYKITSYSAPLTEIGLNNFEARIRFRDLQIIK